MNTILSDEATSFRILRPRLKNGSFKPFLCRAKRNDNTVYLNLTTNAEEIFTGIKSLFGELGPSRFFMRYYFPKRFVYETPFEIKPRRAVKIDPDTKIELVKKNIKGFKSIPRNRIMDRRNLILDFTDLLDNLIPTRKETMQKTKVIQYVMNIYPEILCYILFDNNKHVQKEEDSEESYKNYDITEERYKEYPLLKKFEELSEEDWNKLEALADSEASIEAFTEVLFAKTSVFAMSGTPMGVSSYGFDKFIISFPFNLTKYNLLDKPHLIGKVDFLRQYKINPEFIYQASMMKFIYGCYDAYFNGSSNNELINELIKHDVTFHIYAKNGTGFCLNLRELKNILHYNPNRFMSQYINRIKFLCMLNSNVITETDLDELENDNFEKEFDLVTSNANPGELISLNRDLISDLKPIVDQDTVLNKLIESKITEEPVEDIYENGRHLSHKETAINKASLDIALNKFRSSVDNIKVKTTKTLKIISDDPEEPPIELDDKDINSILDETTDTDDDTEIVEETDANNALIEAKLERMEETDSDDSAEFDDEYEFNDEEENEDDSSDLEWDEENDEDSDDNYLADDDESKKKTKTSDTAKELKTRPEDNYKAHVGPKDAKRIALLKEKYKSLKVNGEEITKIIGNAANISIDKEKKLGSKIPKTSDPSVTNMNLSNFNKAYVKNNYQADLINAVRSLSVNKEVPLYITDVKIEDASDQFTDKMTYGFTLEDEFGKKHNLKFDIPKLDENGLMKISGSKAYLKKQLIRKPIVKIGPNKVYITTELNSYQIYRHGIIINKSAEVVRRLLTQFFIDYDKKSIKIERGNCENDNKDYLTTLEYDTLAKDYYSITINPKSKYNHSISIIFSQKVIRKQIEELKISTGYENNAIPDNILPIAIDYTTKTLYSIDMKANSSVNSTIINLLVSNIKDDKILDFIKKIKTPKRRVMTKAEIQSFNIPLIAFLNYLFSWDRVKSYFPENEIEFSETPIKKTSKLNIKFHDGYLYYNQYPMAGAMLLNGLVEIDTENYRYEDLNNPQLYIDYTYDKYKTRNIVKGWITLKESMLDFKTLQILEALNLPTDLLEIFLYCNDLLTDNHCLPESDISNYRIRSNEIITQCLYQVLNKQYTVFKKRSGKKVTMSIPREAVMAEVYKTDILGYYDAISPIGEMRNQGLTTFKGPGGTKLEQAFTKPKRSFDKSYFGVFGISTPDNKSAGVVKELTVNTNIVNTLGFIGETDTKNYNFNDIVPAAEAIAPFATRVDDPSRVAFISGQNNHVGGLLNASLPCVRTGVEKTIQFQCSDNFVIRAKGDGLVTEVDEINKKIYITYKDGTKACEDYNDKYLKNSDAFNTATFKCYVSANTKVKEGDVLAADARFFKVDPFTNDIVYTQHKNALVAIMEGSYTEDDADAITQEFADEIKMDFTERKQICLKAMDTIIDYKKVGDKVNLGDKLFVFDDSGTFEEGQDSSGDDDFLDLIAKEMGVDDMSEMIHQTPKAPMTGTITSMKVYWTCPVEKMSKTMAKFVNSYIATIKKEILAEEKYTGKVSEKRKQIIPIDKNNYTNGAPRINGLIVDDPNGNVVVEYFISSNNGMGVGDKIALNTSIKSINSFIIPKGQEPFTESGLKVDGIFSYISCCARMVQSIWYQWLGTILYIKTKRIAKGFLKEIGAEIPKNTREIRVLP